MIRALTDYLNVKDMSSFLYAPQRVTEDMRKDPKQKEYADFVVERVRGKKEA